MSSTSQVGSHVQEHRRGATVQGDAVLRGGVEIEVCGEAGDEGAVVSEVGIAEAGRARAAW
ncbi:hypothetical protein [Actinomadura rudentiformis]|uniref:Uncharacterized protein n=1 Tax=Actinomadura rudentiformis TaxID=359158 RepID=A0A6H9YKT9_9ACTN|nr:hypothetical protein [Actinomadura rudentiformis]KAB2340859.1 hypothetical protein F8566_43890 [Actinomadura rudentiformis]